jgi:hypothetical protein
MTESVVIVQVTTPVVQITNPAQGVVEIQQNAFDVSLSNVCDVAVVTEGATVVEVGDVSEVAAQVVNVVVEVADTSFEVVEVGEQGPAAEDIVKLQEVSDVEVTGNGPAEITTIWKGEAQPGQLHTQAVWRVRKIIVETGADGDATVHWADGTAAFTKVWEATPGDALYKSYDFDPN